MPLISRYLLLFVSLISFALASPTPSPFELTDDISEEQLNELAARTPCANGVHIIAGRGAGAPTTYGKLISLIHDVQKAIPGTTAQTITYFKGEHIGDGSYDAMVGRKTIKQYVARCPNVKIVLIGYSKGATVVMDALCGAEIVPMADEPPLPARYAKNIIATVLYGDESYTKGLKGNAGTCKTTGPSPRLQTAGCKPFESGFKSWCDAGDPLCCVGGTNFNTHYTYPQRYDLKSLAFIQQKYNASK